MCISLTRISLLILPSVIALITCTNHKKYQYILNGEETRWIYLFTFLNSNDTTTVKRGTTPKNFTLDKPKSRFFIYIQVVSLGMVGETGMPRKITELHDPLSIKHVISFWTNMAIWTKFCHQFTGMLYIAQSRTIFIN